MIEAALVFELISRGMIEQSTTRSPSIPRTRSSGSTTAMRVHAHLAAADRVVVGLAEAAGIGPVLAVLTAGARHVLALDVFPEGGLGHDLARQLEAAQRHLESYCSAQ